MPHFSVLLAVLLALAAAGCAVSGGVSTASVSARGGDVTVRSSHWGGSLACGTDRPGAPPCEAMSVAEPLE